jgi:hypothetical protein
MAEGYIFTATNMGLYDIKWSDVPKFSGLGGEPIEPQNRSLLTGVRELRAWRCLRCQWIVMKVGTKEQGILGATELEARHDVAATRRARATDPNP